MARYTCEDCGHTLNSRHESLDPRHRCPKCGSAKLKPVKA
jgi:DNA-directed RNA polymerase subunit RPC12/RpoP